MLDDIVALCQSDRLYCGIPSLSVIAIGDTGWKSQWNMGIPYCVSDNPPPFFKIFVIETKIFIFIYNWYPK